MKINMTYKVVMMINKPKDLVSKLYVDRDMMATWEKGLVRIEDTKLKLFEENSEGYLVFSFNDQESKMKVTVTQVTLPDTITQIYEVPGAWNECINTFENVDGLTKWTMDVTFKMEAPYDIPKEAFIKKTTQGMEIFKAFVESVKEEDYL
ncbi:MAG: hypothetical protein EP317_05310 [Bacillota bacterium]|nr:MAG: hypothetical protein EP317_05310 [Bacillota bacterium]